MARFHPKGRAKTFSLSDTLVHTAPSPHPDLPDPSPPHPGLPEQSLDEGPAHMLLALYVHGFADKYGDGSDQPATLIGSLAGDYAFILYDATNNYLLAARSVGGHCPMYWVSAASACPSHTMSGHRKPRRLMCIAVPGRSRGPRG